MNIALTTKVRLGQFGFIRNIINNVYTIMNKHCFGEVGQGRPQYFGISVRFKGFTARNTRVQGTGTNFLPRTKSTISSFGNTLDFSGAVQMSTARYKDTQCGKQILYNVQLGSSMQLGVRTSMLYLILLYIGQFCSQCFQFVMHH